MTQSLRQKMIRHRLQAVAPSQRHLLLKHLQQLAQLHQKPRQSTPLDGTTRAALRAARCEFYHEVVFEVGRGLDATLWDLLRPVVVRVRRRWYLPLHVEPVSPLAFRLRHHFFETMPRPAWQAVRRLIRRRLADYGLELRAEGNDFSFFSVHARGHDVPF